MKDLRILLASVGFESVKTYIQSGNIMVQSQKDVVEVEATIFQLIKNHFGFEVSVLVRTYAEWGKCLDQNPFDKKEEDPDYRKKLNVTFLKEDFSLKQIEKIDDALVSGEVYVLGDKCLYLWCENGFGRSKVATFISGNPSGTTRNWNTVLNILEMGSA